MLRRTIVLLLTACAFAAAAEENFNPPADAEAAAIVAKLGAGESALLPAAKVVGEMNDEGRKWGLDKHGPGGRNYCIKMMYEPDRKRAIFCGANHGVPHRLNDVWEYDLAANAWICLYAPDASKTTDIKNWSDTELVDGVLRTKRGGPAIVGHQWWQCTYDPEKKAMLFLSSWTMFPKEIKAQYFETGKNEHSPPLWAFYPETRKWEPVRTQKPAPDTGIAVYLEYVPTLKQSAFVNAGWKSPGMWLYDGKTDAWKELFGGEKFKAKNDPALVAGDGVMVFAPGRNLLIASKGQRTVHYDVANNKWSTGYEGADAPQAHDSFSPCGYDSNAGLFLLYDQKNPGFWGYDPGAKKWSKLTPKGPPPPTGGKVIGYYDDARNVFVLNLRTQIWVYRHKIKDEHTAAK